MSFFASQLPSPRPLARRYALLLCGVTLTLLLASGMSEMVFSYRESRIHIAAVQAAQTEGAARELALYLGDIVRGVRDVGKLPWGMPNYGPAERRQEFYRLMQLQPAITDVQVIDRAGREQLAVSKRENDREASLRSFDDPALVAVSEKAPVRYGRSYYRDGLTPSMRVAVFDGVGAVVATVDLRLLDDVVARLRVGRGGVAYIVDSNNLLIAHPRATEVLRQLDLGTFAPVRHARAIDASEASAREIPDAVDLQGKPVIATFARVDGPDWLVFVEQPQIEALQPALATLLRTLLLIAVGASAAVVTGIWFARRMAAPIVELSRATERIALGDLASPIKPQGDAEIASLAHDFNLMTERLKMSYAQLEAKVAERTAQLSAARDTLQAQSVELETLNQRLSLQVDDLALRREEAERANAAKSRFLATASHDLRQPMHSIGLLVGVLRDRLTDISHLSLADKVQSSVSSMENLFGTLLDISKLDAGGVQPRLESIDVGTLFARLAQTWMPLASEQGLEFRVRSSPQPAILVRSDPVLLERSLANLLSNAIRYTRHGGVLLACRKRGSGYGLQVWDTGPGIAEVHHESVFEEFFRIDTQGGGDVRGLGLGLSIVQRSAQILDHPLRLHSRLGRGSMFEIEVPFAGRSTLSALHSGFAAGEAGAIAGTFVLIVENDEDSRNALKDLLEQRGCHALVAASCDDMAQLSAAHLRTPDLIVADFQLGTAADGLEAIERLREQHEACIPALLITANTDSGLLARATAAGVSLLHKPIGRTRLLLAVQQMLAQRAEA